MKIQLARKELKQALDLYIESQGLNKEIKDFTIGRTGNVSVVLVDKEPENEIPQGPIIRGDADESR